jgi:hypothetical protein
LVFIDMKTNFQINFFGIYIMSGAPTKYDVSGTDLITIFAPYVSGTKAAVTGYEMSISGDLNNVFAPYVSGTKAAATGYLVPTLGDLNNVFAIFSAGLPSVFPPFSVTGTSNVTTYTNSTYVVTFLTNGTMTFLANAKKPTTVEYLLVGAGGAGGSSWTSNINYGGGGGAGGQVLKTSNILGSPASTTTLNFIVPGITTAVGAKGADASASGTGITTVTSVGGNGGGTGQSSSVAGGLGGVGANGGGSGGIGGYAYGNQGTKGGDGTGVLINGTTYYFGGGGSGGNDTTGSPIGGLGGGGGSGGGGNGNNASNPYIGPNGISLASSSTGYLNTGGGGAGTNGNRGVGFHRAGGSGIIVVWFTYT